MNSKEKERLLGVLFLVALPELAGEDNKCTEQDNKCDCTERCYHSGYLKCIC
jgi:hypothetical protein